MSDSRPPKGGDAQDQHPSVADDRPHPSEGAPSSLPTQSPSPAAHRPLASASSFLRPRQLIGTGTGRRYLEHRHSRLRALEEDELTIRNSRLIAEGFLEMEASRRGSVISSPAFEEIQGGEEEGVSTMADVDAVLHIEEVPELPAWMSELFEKLDMEMNEDSDCSTEEVAHKETYPLLEGRMSSEIHKSSKGGGSVMFEKLDMDMNEDSVCSTGEVAHIETYPLSEGCISSETRWSSKWAGSVIAPIEGVDDEDNFLDWMSNVINLAAGARDDMSYLYEVGQEEKYPVHSGPSSMSYIYKEDQEEKHPVHSNPSDEYLVDKEAKDYPKTVKRISYRETIENGLKWMSDECFLAFTKYAENLNVKSAKYKFGELRHQCLSVEAYDNVFHHFNFTIEAQHEGSNVWTSNLYFAEVKEVSGLKIYFCCPLDPTDKGRCYGCKSQDVYDLQHPNIGGYKEGDADIYWPFETDTDCDTDSSDDYEL
ncbi:hypothetical protein EJB05_29694 [Eragrostis curvula]|uniref:DUF3615 domain-containing protein n=1 Tax=Eragrostis curvula TaxID=38414 RepID=A0A5J9UUP5_9POAL|nr:hypothetical protein EJB05_29694 [Eragrostis curvula]